jgi:hypothetical protein
MKIKKQTAVMIILGGYLLLSLVGYFLASMLTGHYDPANWDSDAKTAFAITNVFALVPASIFSILILIGEVKLPKQ